MRSYATSVSHFTFSMLLSIPATIDGALLRAVDAEYHEERFALARQDPVRFLAGGRFGRAVHVRHSEDERVASNFFCFICGIEVSVAVAMIFLP
jgi:hypothetical protein